MVDVESHVGLARSIVVQLCSVWYCTLYIVYMYVNKVMCPIGNMVSIVFMHGNSIDCYLLLHTG